VRVAIRYSDLAENPAEGARLRFVLVSIAEPETSFSIFTGTDISKTIALTTDKW